ncbi:hypothetical protein GALL_449900 [mine drainage metagenome]|uniref:Uncharacterized protein n=1 Tax=mine drainage metagenome TaxID=410659 RepID=A0A1J5Q7D3_9ZZZZ
MGCGTWGLPLGLGGSLRLGGSYVSLKPQRRFAIASLPDPQDTQQSGVCYRQMHMSS